MFEQLKGFFSSLLMASITISISCALILASWVVQPNSWHLPMVPAQISVMCQIRETINGFFNRLSLCFAFKVKTKSRRYRFPLTVTINPILIEITVLIIGPYNFISELFRNVMNLIWSGRVKLNNVWEAVTDSMHQPLICDKTLIGSVMIHLPSRGLLSRSMIPPSRSLCNRQHPAIRTSSSASSKQYLCNN